MVPRVCLSIVSIGARLWFLNSDLGTYCDVGFFLSQDLDQLRLLGKVLTAYYNMKQAWFNTVYIYTNGSVFQWCGHHTFSG